MTTNEQHQPNPAGAQPQAEKSSDSTAQALLRELGDFTGTEHYYRFGPGITLLTDGVRFLADAANCYWLLVAIGSYQAELAKHPDARLQGMQFWTLQVNPDQSAILTCVADSPEPPVISQRIEWTDFPLPEIQIWVAPYGEDIVALLPSEY